MATLNDRIGRVAFKLGNRTDLTAASGSSTSGVISGIALVAIGSDYNEGDELLLNGGTDGVIQVDEVDAEGMGTILAFTLINAGYSFSTGVQGVVGGAGTGATFNITSVTTISAPSRILGWLEDAFINLCMAYPFEQLEETFSFTLNQGQSIYDYPPNVRAIKTLTLYRSDGTVITVLTKDMKYIRRMNNINPGAPSIWAPFNETIQFRPVPDANGPYTCVIDTWMKPILANPIQNTIITLPIDWFEALDYSATVRGHAELQEDDKAKSLQALLFGSTDPSTGKYTPGLIQNLMNRQQATTPYVDYGIQPQGQTQGYTK